MKDNKGLVVISGLIIFVSMGLVSCATIGNGRIISQERTAGEFNSVTLSGVAKINIHFADSHRVVVTTDDNIQDTVTTVTKNNMLTVGTIRKSMKYADITVDVYLPKIDMINLDGVGNIEIEEGEGLDFDIRHDGVGDINAEKYCVENVTIKHSGVGDIKIWATNSLNGKASGVGSIKYKENPRMNMEFHGVGGFKKIK